MREKAIVWGVVLVCIFSFTAVTRADYDDFIDLKKQRLLTKECVNEFKGCTNTCDEGKKLKKCNIACTKQQSKCLDNAQKNSVLVNKLPPKAKKLYQKINKKQDKAFVSCQNTFQKEVDKCLKESDEDNVKTTLCLKKKKAAPKMYKCVNEAGKKHSFKTKKMVKLLKGKKPA